MLVQPIPKTKSKRKHKARNNPKPTQFDYCTVCGRPYAELHEVFFGPYRQKSIKYGLQERLCYDDHRGPTGPHHNRARDLELKCKHQAIFEQTHTRAEFMAEFGQSYL